MSGHSFPHPHDYADYDPLAQIRASSAVMRLILSDRRDAWNVQILTHDEHDVLLRKTYRADTADEAVAQALDDAISALLDAGESHCIARAEYQGGARRLWNVLPAQTPEVTPEEMHGSPRPPLIGRVVAQGEDQARLLAKTAWSLDDGGFRVCPA